MDKKVFEELCKEEIEENLDPFSDSEVYVDSINKDSAGEIDDLILVFVYEDKIFNLQINSDGSAIVTKSIRFFGERED